MFVCPECGNSAAHSGVCNVDGIALAYADDPLLGQTIGSYRVARLIGSGGMGRVYRAVQPHIGSRVAIKVLSEQCATSPALTERFFAEARAVNLIRHESIVNVLDLAALPDGRPYIVMEHLDGSSLSEIIRQSGVLPLGALCRLLIEVLDALSAAHAKGIVHRDLKPDNVFVTPAGRAKVLDFGIAKLRPEGFAIGEGTSTGALLGTPHYMSPEQALGRPVDVRSDIYSAGVILYEGATGRKPFDPGTLYELLKQHVESYPPAPRSLRPDIPLAYEAVIRRALDKDVASRFQSAREFANALEECARSLPADAFRAVTGVPQPALPSAFVPRGFVMPGASRPALTPFGAPADPSPGQSETPNTLSGTKGAQARSPLPYIALAGCGVLALGGMVTLVAVAIVAMNKGAPDAADDPGVIVERGPSTASKSGQPKDPESAVADFDRKRFDPWAFLPRAEEMAKKHYADAVLARLDSSGVNKTGTVDLTQRLQNNVLYRFRSPAHSKPPPDHPENVEFESNCVVYVMASTRGISSFVPDSGDCSMPLIGRPRCSLTQIWQQAVSRGAPTGNVVGDLGFWADEDTKKARWYVNIDPGFSEFVPDAC